MDPFITDLGCTPELTNEETGEVIRLGRYGVWRPDEQRRKMEVVATGDDLEQLQRVWGPGLRVERVVAVQRTVVG